MCYCYVSFILCGTGHGSLAPALFSPPRSLDFAHSAHRITLCLPGVLAAGACNKVKWLLAWPLCLMLYFTVPNCSTPRWENWFMLSFVISTMWIAAFSYIMVWMVREQRHANTQTGRGIGTQTKQPKLQREKGV